MYLRISGLPNGSGGDEDAEACARQSTLRSRLRFYMTSVAVDDFLRNPESQTVAYIGFGGEKGLEDTIRCVRGNTRTVILYHQADP